MSNNRPPGDPEIAVEMLQLRVAELEAAIRRIADQDATLSVQGGNVTVTMDATLTKDERKAIEYVVRHGRSQPGSTDTLRGLLERLE